MLLHISNTLGVDYGKNKSDTSRLQEKKMMIESI